MLQQARIAIDREQELEWLKLQESELQVMRDNYNTVAVTAGLLAGFAFTAASDTPPEPAQMAIMIKYFYYAVCTLCLLMLIFCITIATICGTIGPDMLLNGANRRGKSPGVEVQCVVHRSVGGMRLARVPIYGSFFIGIGLMLIAATLDSVYKIGEFNSPASDRRPAVGPGLKARARAAHVLTHPLSRPHITVPAPAVPPHPAAPAPGDAPRPVSVSVGNLTLAVPPAQMPALASSLHSPPPEASAVNTQEVVYGSHEYEDGMFGMTLMAGETDFRKANNAGIAFLIIAMAIVGGWHIYFAASRMFKIFNSTPKELYRARRLNPHVACGACGLQTEQGMCYKERRFWMPRWFPSFPWESRNLFECYRCMGQRHRPGVNDYDDSDGEEYDPELGELQVGNARCGWLCGAASAEREEPATAYGTFPPGGRIEPEYRIDPRDGRAKTRGQFLDRYGDNGNGWRMWDKATVPRTEPDSRLPPSCRDSATSFKSLRSDIAAAAAAPPRNSDGDSGSVEDPGPAPGSEVGSTACASQQSRRSRLSRLFSRRSTNGRQSDSGSITRSHSEPVKSVHRSSNWRAVSGERSAREKKKEVGVTGHWWPDPCPDRDGTRVDSPDMLSQGSWVVVETHPIHAPASRSRASLRRASYAGTAHSSIPRASPPASQHGSLPRSSPVVAPVGETGSHEQHADVRSSRTARSSYAGTAHRVLPKDSPREHPDGAPIAGREADRRS